MPALPLAAGLGRSVTGAVRMRSPAPRAAGPDPPCGGAGRGAAAFPPGSAPAARPGGERGLLGVSERGLETPLELERGAGALVTGLDLPGCSQCYPRYPWHSVAFTAGCFPLHLILLPAYPLLKLAKILYVLHVVFTSSNCSLVAVMMTVPALFSSSSSRTVLQFHLCNVIEIRFSFYLV